MTRDETILAAMDMMKWGESKYMDGEEVQYSPKQGNGSRVWTSTDNPLWNWEHYDYRIKPAATIRPWTADEVPLGAWMRKKQDVSRRGVVIDTGDEFCRRAWFHDSEHSTDGGKTWKECGVMEETK